MRFSNDIIKDNLIHFAKCDLYNINKLSGRVINDAFSKYMIKVLKGLGHTNIQSKMDSIAVSNDIAWGFFALPTNKSRYLDSNVLNSLRYFIDTHDAIQNGVFITNCSFIDYNNESLKIIDKSNLIHLLVKYEAKIDGYNVHDLLSSNNNDQIHLSHTIKHQIHNKVKQVMEKINNLNGDQFETYMTKFLNKIGYQDVNHTPFSNDHGADAVSRKESISWQFKNYKHEVPFHAVEEVMFSSRFYHTRINEVLTNSYFSRNTWNTVRTMNIGNFDRPVILIDGHILSKLIYKYEIHNSKIVQEEKARKARIIQEKHAKKLEAIKEERAKKVRIAKRKRKFLRYKRYVHNIYRPRIKELHLRNNELEAKIRNSIKDYNFHNPAIQFAYCAIKLLPTHHIYKELLINKLKNINTNKGKNWYTGESKKYNKYDKYPYGAQINFNYLSNYYYFHIDIPYTFSNRITLNKQHANQRLLFIYYPKYILFDQYSYGYPVQDYDYNYITQFSTRNTSSTIISNFMFIPNSGRFTISHVDNNDSRNIYNNQVSNYSSIKLNKIHTSLITVDDINTLYQSINTYHDLNRVRNRKITNYYITKEIHAKRLAKELAYKKLVMKRASKYHKINNELEEYIAKSKSIYNFNSKIKQFAFCALMLLPTYHCNNRDIIINKINQAKIIVGKNWDDGLNNNHHPFGEQAKGLYTSLTIYVRYRYMNRILKRNRDIQQQLTFIYYSPLMMNAYYGNTYPYQNYTNNVLPNSHSNMSTIISNFKFNSNNELNFNKTSVDNDDSLDPIHKLYHIYGYKHIADHIITINDISTMKQSMDTYNDNSRLNTKKCLLERHKFYNTQVKPYIEMDKNLENCINHSKAIHQFSNRTKQFAFCALMLLPTYHLTKQDAINAINLNNAYHTSNEHQPDVHFQQLVITIPYEYTTNSSYQKNKTKQQITFIYYEPEQMNNSYFYGNQYQTYLANNFYSDDNIHTVISNFKFNTFQSKTNLPFKYTNIDGNDSLDKSISYDIHHYYLKYNSSTITIDDIDSLKEGANTYGIKERKINIKDNQRYLTFIKEHKLHVLKKHKLHKALHEAKIKEEKELKHKKEIQRQTKLKQELKDKRTKEHEAKVRKERELEYKKEQRSHKEQKSNKILYKVCPICRIHIPIKTRICPNCNYHFTENPNLVPIYKMCPSCGLRTLANSNFCENCGYPFKNNKNGSFKVCPRCHTEMKMDYKVCMYCGYRFQDYSL